MKQILSYFKTLSPQTYYTVENCELSVSCVLVSVQNMMTYITHSLLPSFLHQSKQRKNIWSKAEFNITTGLLSLQAELLQVLNKGNITLLFNRIFHHKQKNKV